MDELYASLPVDKPGAIRIIEIAPGKLEDDIVLSMRCASLDDPGLSYEGLSYTWGDPSNPRTITCNGIPFQATRNLFSALRRLREIEQRVFWIDAICINQNDVYERAEQVKQMLRIYKQATAVFLDLGEAPDNMQDLFELLIALNKVLSAHENDTMLFHPSQFPELGLPPVDDKAWVAWQEVLARAYFSRLWVIQEFAVSTELYMLLGKTFFPSSNLYQISSGMQIHGIGEENRPMPSTSKLALAAIDGKNALRNLQFMRDRHQTNDYPLKLAHLLTSSRRAHSSDPKDKMFGVIGLATDIDKNDSAFEIKYDKEEPVAQLFTRVVKGSVRVKKDSILEYLYDGGVAENKRIDNLPSWVPDFTSRRAGSPLGGLYGPEYHAADSMELFADIDGNALRVRGRIVDQIQNTTPEFRPDLGGERTLAYFGVSVVRWLRYAFDLTQSIWPGALAGGEDNTVKQRLWRTLICNKTHNDTLAPSDYAQEFEALLMRQRFVEEALAKADDDDNVMVEDREGQYFRVETRCRQYRQALQNTMFQKKFCVTRKKQLMGMVPGDTQPGDYVVIVAGSSVPFVLRKVTAENDINAKWTLIQECYVHGAMNGEFAQDKNQEAWDNFVVV